MTIVKWLRSPRLSDRNPRMETMFRHRLLLFIIKMALPAKRWPAWNPVLQQLMPNLSVQMVRWRWVAPYTYDLWMNHHRVARISAWPLPVPGWIGSMTLTFPDLPGAPWYSLEFRRGRGWMTRPRWTDPYTPAQAYDAIVTKVADWNISD